MIVKKNTLLIQDDIISEYLKQETESLFFDIETTGLFWKKSHLYLIGVVYHSDGEWILQQWFLDHPSEEALLLQAFSHLCSGRKKVIHYNGNSFDLPYLQHKYTFYQLENPLVHMESLDLYRKVKPYQNLLELSAVRQKDIERFLQIQRTDCYSGGELIQVYKDYLSDGDDSLLGLLLQHNLDDVRGLVFLLPVLAYTRIAEGAFIISGVTFQDRILTLNLQLDVPIPRKLSSEGAQARITLTESSGILQIYGQAGIMKHFFPDYKNYYYLPSEDQAVHKSIGVYVDPEHREKAKAGNCYQKMEGLFFPQLRERFEPIFYQDYRKQPAYFQYKESLLQNMPDFHAYALDFLQQLFFQ